MCGCVYTEGGEEEDEDNSIVVAALPTQTRSSVGYAVRRRKSKVNRDLDQVMDFKPYISCPGLYVYTPAAEEE